MKTATEHEFRFLFLGLERDWNTYEGDAPPEGRVFVYRSLPGNLLAWGSSREQAVLRLRRAVELAMTTAASPDEWYKTARAQMSAKEIEDECKVTGEAWKDQRTRVGELEGQTYRIVVLETAPRYVSASRAGSSALATPC